MSSVAPTNELWFLTGSQHLYGPEVLDQVAEPVADDRQAAR